MHILIVEDNPADAFLTRMALGQQQSFQFDSTVVEDGEPAIAFLKGEPPFQGSPKTDLVLLDLNLPRLDGMAVLHWIRNNPKTAALPVFVLSSSPADAQLEAAAEATRYLEKPGTLDDYMQIGKILAEYLGPGLQGR